MANEITPDCWQHILHNMCDRVPRPAIIKYELSNDTVGLKAFLEGGNYYHIHSNEMTKLEKWIHSKLLVAGKNISAENELQEISKMLSATKVKDADRLDAIIKRLQALKGGE